MKIPNKWLKKLVQRKANKFWRKRCSYFLPGYRDPFYYYQVYHEKVWLLFGIFPFFISKKIIQDLEETRVIMADCMGDQINIWKSWDEINEINHKAGRKIMS